jgi:hypothetical protein
MRQLALELDELRIRLGRYDDRAGSEELSAIGDSVRRISEQLRERAALLGTDVTAHRKPELEH